jgi:hypothetical protein
VIAVAAGDLHLSDSPPLFRSAEPDWFGAMERQLGELKRLAQSFGGVPLLVPGDVFHRWNPSPKLINFAMRHLPFCYAVPGQHDLRHHSYADVKDTAYWTLVQAGKLFDLKPGVPQPVEGMLLWGFPWGSPPAPRPPHAILEGLHVAVCHRYVWTESCSHPGADPAARLGAVRASLKGYDAAVFGDNHLGFVSHRPGECTVVNCGGFMRRNSDQRGYRPSAWLLHSDGSARRHFYDVSEDVCLEAGPSPEAPALEEFLCELGSLGGATADFREAVYRACKNGAVSEGAMGYVRKALGDG